LPPLDHRAPARRPVVGASKPLRIGVIGTGFGASVHIPALKFVDDTEVVAVASRREDRAKAVAARHGIPVATTDWREIIADPDIDGVVVATPPYLHHPMVIAALENEKHVLCEKPMARSLAESRDMVKLAENANVVAMVNHEFRYVPVRARVKELIDEGYIGEPHGISISIFRETLADPNDRPFSWLMEQDKAGGMLGASGSHLIDTLRWWMGDIQAVCGTVTTAVKQRRLPDSTGTARVDADDNFAFLLKFASGAIGSVHYSATAPIDAGEEITISGADGMLITHGDDHLYGAKRRDIGMRELQIPDRLIPKLPDFGHALTRPTVMLIRDWVKAIRATDPSPHAPSFADGAKVQEILDGVIRSGVQGRWIDTSGTRWPIAVGSSHYG
jgi:predicted dehydrogenase